MRTWVRMRFDPAIISDTLTRDRGRVRAVQAAIWIGALAVGLGAAAFYANAGLTLSHYDAKAHLVVARRVIDSITPGWEQVGAVWLPLPHLVHVLPVQVDVLYRTGAFGVLVSVLSFATAAGAIARIVIRTTGSAVAACSGALLFALNPNILYLQATPMTEAMLLGLLSLSTALVYEWAVAEGARSPLAASAALAAACWTRYEAWPVAGVMIGTASISLLRARLPVSVVVRRVSGLALGPAIALASFFLLSRATVGEWFVSGFFVPENPSRGDLVETARQISRGARALGGDALLAATLVSTIVIVAVSLLDRVRAPLLVTIAPLAAGLLPFYAFYQGHPYRVRYMVPLVAASALVSGVGLGFTRRAAWVLAPGLAAIVIVAVPPLDAQAPMVREAQWDVPNSRARLDLSQCLASRRPDEKILMSMGSLAHYMQELSQRGLGVADFVHEGNHPLWDEMLLLPRRHVAWMVIDERSEGGDLLAILARTSPYFLEGFNRVCESAGVAVYHRPAS